MARPTGLLPRLGPSIVARLFAGDSSGHAMALDAAKGTTLWHASVGANQANGAITYELDGRQYILVGAGDTLVAFALPL